MTTNMTELRSEAAIYAEGTPFSTDYLVGQYTAYCLDMLERAGEPVDFQRWVAVAFPSCCNRSLLGD